MPEGALAAIMVGVFRQGGLSNRHRQATARVRLVPTVLAAILLTSACGTRTDPPTSEVPVGEAIPNSLDGLWILENGDLNLDIDVATAEVDGRTSCARLLGSLTFINGGAVASFSLPGRDDSACSADEIDEVDELQELLQSVASVRGEAGGYRLFNADGGLLGRLRGGS